MPTVGMSDPNKGMEASIPYVARELRSNRQVVNRLTMTGPTSGTNGVASTAFTVSVPTDQVVPYPITVVPADSGTGTAGVFTPTSLRLDDQVRSATFTYTPGSTGVKVISVTNTLDNRATLISSSVTNPATISYTSS